MSKEEFKRWIYANYNVPGNNCTMAPDMLDGILEWSEGMEPEELSRITEALYMVDKARSRKQHGAGLGLALADKCLGLHGDRLSFESEKGIGTMVCFSLKLSPALERDRDEDRQQAQRGGTL